MENNTSSQATATTETTPNSTANQRQPPSVSHPVISTLATTRATSSETATWLRNTALSVKRLIFTRHTEGTTATQSLKLRVSEQHSEFLIYAMTRAFSGQSDNQPVPVGHSAVPFTLITKTESGYLRKTVDLHHPTEQSIALAKGIAMIYANGRLPPELAPKVITSIFNVFMGQTLFWPLRTGRSANPSTSASNVNQLISTDCTFSISIIFIQLVHSITGQSINQSVVDILDLIRDDDGNPANPAYVIESDNLPDSLGISGTSARTTATANSNQPVQTASSTALTTTTPSHGVIVSTTSSNPTASQLDHSVITCTTWNPSTTQPLPSCFSTIPTSELIDSTPLLNLVITLIHEESAPNHIYDIFVLIGVQRRHIIEFIETIVNTVDNLVENNFVELLEQYKNRQLQSNTILQLMIFYLKNDFKQASLVMQDFCRFLDAAKQRPNWRTTYILLSIPKILINNVLDNIFEPDYTNEYERISRLRAYFRTDRMTLVGLFTKLLDDTRYQYSSDLCHCKKAQKKVQLLHIFCHRLTQCKQLSTIYLTNAPTATLITPIHYDTTEAHCTESGNFFYSIGHPDWSIKGKYDNEDRNEIHDELYEFLYGVKKLFKTRPQRYQDIVNVLVSYGEEYNRRTIEARVLLTEITKDEPELCDMIEELFQRFSIYRDDLDEPNEGLEIESATVLHYLGPMIQCNAKLMPEGYEAEEEPIAWSDFVREYDNWKEFFGAEPETTADLPNTAEQIETMKSRMAAMQEELDYYKAKEGKKRQKTSEETQFGPSTSGICVKKEEETD